MPTKLGPYSSSKSGLRNNPETDESGNGVSSRSVDFERAAPPEAEFGGTGQVFRRESKPAKLPRK